MADFKSESTIKFTITMKMSEEEARALQAITEYGTASFLKCFYENLGSTYLQPHEEGIHSLFDTIYNEIPTHIAKVNKAREVFK